MPPSALRWEIIMKRNLFGILASLTVTGLLSSGCISTHRTEVVGEPIVTTTRTTRTVVVTSEPPPPKVEVRGTAPSETHVWVDGNWTYQNDHWVWLPGHWEERPRLNALWVPGHWDRNPDGSGWVWTEGYWQ
jgi:hypothetical protein